MRKLKSDVITLWFCQKHPDTPFAARAVAVFTVGHALSPIDLIPDFIPVLGYVDEVIVLPACIYLALRLIPEHVKAESRLKAAEWERAGADKPRSKVAAVVIVTIWVLVVYLGWRWFAGRD